MMMLRMRSIVHMMIRLIVVMSIMMNNRTRTIMMRIVSYMREMRTRNWSVIVRPQTVIIKTIVRNTVYVNNDIVIERVIV